MPTIDINITGGTYKSRSRSLTAQKTQNMYPEIVDDDAPKSKYVLHGWPGLTLFGLVPGVDRGTFNHQGILYKVSGNTLYLTDQDGAHSTLGTIEGSGRCVFEGIGSDLIIVSDGRVWVYNTAPGVNDFIYTGKKATGLLSGATDLFVSPDGSNVYTTITSVIQQYSIIGGDISTAEDTGNTFDPSSEEPISSGISFSPDGLNMYIVGTTNDTVYQYILSAAWDVSTASYASKFFDVSSEDNFPLSLDFNFAGTIMYVLGGTADDVFQYTLSTAWDVSTASYASKSLDLSSEGGTMEGITVNLDGSILLAVDAGNDTVYQYNLTTSHDLSTGSYSGLSLLISSEQIAPAGVFFDNNGTTFYLCGNNPLGVYQYSSTKEVTDSDLETPNAVAVLNNQAIYDGDNARWCTSDVGDASSITAANYASAESSPDNLLRPYVYDQILYLFGEKTTETWYNSGVGNPPFDRIEGGIFTIGLAAIHSTAHNDNNLYFLGDDNKVYRLPTKQSVSDIALTHAIESYTAVADAIGLCYSFENQNFYQLTFPSENKTWVYSEPTNQWIELLSGNGRYFGNSHAYAYRKNLIADYRNGNIYELDINAFDDNGTTVKRIRETGAIHGGLVGAPGKRIEMNRFELIMEVGVGVSAGQGIEPVVMLSYSDDGGKTFSTERWGNIGHLGDYLRKVEWHGLGSFESRIIRISISDPVQLSIHSAAADIEVGV